MAIRRVSTPTRLRHALGLTVRLAAVGAISVLARSTAFAQTDYYNTDAGRPIRIEDAYATERRALEIQFAPFRLERGRGGRYQWGVEPEVAFGILPRTHIEVGAPIAFLDGGRGQRTVGLAGIDVSVLHNLNIETSIPALAVVVSGLLPAGHLGPERAYGSIKGIMTRTFRWARFHVNSQYTFGDADDGASGGVQVGSGVVEVSRWMTGIAVDRAFPLRSLLLTGEVYAERPLRDAEDLRWNTGVGLRYQLNQRFNVDGGIGRRLSGDDQSWHATFGAAVAVGLPWRR